MGTRFCCRYGRNRPRYATRSVTRNLRYGHANDHQFDLVVERRWREEDFKPDQIAPEYKEADRRSGPNQENTERARAGVTGHNVRYVLIFGLLAVIIVFAIVYLIYFH